MAVTPWPAGGAVVVVVPPPTAGAVVGVGRMACGMMLVT